MAFKLNAVPSGTAKVNKQYLFMSVDTGPIGREWIYVTADAPALVESSGYITASTDADHQQAVDGLRVGDVITVYQVGALDDTRSLEADMDAGITDISKHVVLKNTGSIINMSSDLLAATVTYTV